MKESWTKLEAAGASRAVKLEQSLKAQQFLQDALEVESWMADRAAALSSNDFGRDRDHAMQLLTRHKAIELELDTYAGIISEMGHSAQAMSAAGNVDAPIILEKNGLLVQTLSGLQKLATLRQKALVESMCRYSVFFYDIDY